MRLDIVCSPLGGIVCISRTVISLGMRPIRFMCAGISTPRMRFTARGRFTMRGIDGKSGISVSLMRLFAEVQASEMVAIR
jgi:hypothetical protein